MWGNTNALPGASEQGTVRARPIRHVSVRAIGCALLDRATLHSDATPEHWPYAFVEACEVAARRLRADSQRVMSMSLGQASLQLKMV